MPPVPTNSGVLSLVPNRIGSPSFLFSSFISTHQVHARRGDADEAGPFSPFPAAPSTPQDHGRPRSTTFSTPTEPPKVDDARPPLVETSLSPSRTPLPDARPPKSQGRTRVRPTSSSSVPSDTSLETTVETRTSTPSVEGSGAVGQSTTTAASQTRESTTSSSAFPSASTPGLSLTESRSSRTERPRFVDPFLD